MIRPIYLFVLIVIMLGINACKISEPVTIQVLSPPDKPLPWKDCRTLVGNRIPSLIKFSGKDSINVGDLTLPQNFLNFLSWENVNAFLDVIAASPVVDSIMLDTLVRPFLSSANFEDPGPVSPDSIIAICLEFDVDRVIFLDALSPFDTLILTLFMGAGENGIPDWGTYAQEWVLPDARWRVYDKMGKINAEVTYNDTLVWEATGMSEREAVSQLPATLDMLSSAMRVSGTYFGRQIAPVWNNVKRFYYVSGSSEMKKAAKLASQGKWLEAAVIWNKEAVKGNNSVQAQASFNMALACEIQDRVELAFTWINKSWEKDPAKITKEYAKILRNRLALSRRIKKIYKPLP